MASLSSPVVSPSSITSGLSDQMSSARGRVPSQSLTSQLASAPRASSTPQLASARYVRQFRAFLDHQREVFDEERALWELERSDLQDQIARLEESLRQAQNHPFSQTASPMSTSMSGSSFSSLSTASGSRQFSTGDEFWRGAGGKSDAQPSRTFSSVSQQPTVSSQHLPSISENVPPQRPGSSSLASSLQQASIAKPKISEVENSRTFDGITFRQDSRAPSIATGGITQESPSLSLSHVSPGTLPLPSSRSGPPDIPYITEHAGHTPLERSSVYGTDGTSSAISSSTATPTEPRKENPPHEPRASFASPPSGRSYPYNSSLTGVRNSDVRF